MESTIGAKHEHVTLDTIEHSFKAVAQDLKSPRQDKDIKSKSVQDLLNTGADYITSLASFASQFGITAPTMFMNGKLVEIEEDAVNISSGLGNHVLTAGCDTDVDTVHNDGTSRTNTTDPAQGRLKEVTKLFL